MSLSTLGRVVSHRAKMKQFLYPHVAECVIWSGLTGTEDGVAADHTLNLLDARSPY